MTVLEELRVKHVVVGKQFEDCENYQKLIKIVKEKKMKVYIVEAGHKIQIEKNLSFNVLWPDSKNVIHENVLNNNSLVGKLVYRDFSMLLVGDIEALAEKEILKKYARNLNVLNATVLKVAHHGSKTSSTREFLEAVKPKYALIGVGQNNRFGHPSDNTIQSLQSIDCKIYRTDKEGEITVKTNGNKMKVEN